MNQEQILKDIVLKSLSEIGENLPHINSLADAALMKLKLFGPQGILDSILFFSFVNNLESRLKTIFGRRVTLISDDVLSSERNPFLDVANLVSFIEERLKEG